MCVEAIKNVILQGLRGTVLLLESINARSSAAWSVRPSGKPCNMNFHYQQSPTDFGGTVGHLARQWRSTVV